VFLVATILAGLLQRMPQKALIGHFINGARGLLGVSFIIGTARGVTAILDNGNITDSIVYNATQLIHGLPPQAFIVILLCLYCLFTLFIASSSGMAVVTMPIIGSLAFAAHVPGREIVNSYLYGMGIMGFMTPAGLLLPSLALVGISIKTWFKFIWPVVAILFVICACFLVIGVKL
jgi:uncharacterized ion transporter superfamily protein YfcC